jgi:hypothetical protein
MSSCSKSIVGYRLNIIGTTTASNLPAREVEAAEVLRFLAYLGERRRVR